MPVTDNRIDVVSNDRRDIFDDEWTPASGYAPKTHQAL